MKAMKLVEVSPLLFGLKALTHCLSFALFYFCQVRLRDRNSMNDLQTASHSLRQQMTRVMQVYCHKNHFLKLRASVNIKITDCKYKFSF